MYSDKNVINFRKKQLQVVPIDGVVRKKTADSCQKNKTIEKVMELEMIRVNETRQTRKQTHLVFSHMWTSDGKNTGHDSRKKTVEGRMGKWGLKGGREREGEEGNGTKEKQILHGFSYVESRFKKSGLEDGWG